MRRSLLSGIACIAAVLLAPCLAAVAAADELSFVPTIVGTSGELGINTSLQNNEYTQGSFRTTSSALFFSERLTLNADGFVYHPRFNVFLARLSPALNQWDTQATSGAVSTSSRSSKSTLDYEFRTIFLPEHPYNLELFALRQEAFGAQNFWLGQQGDVNTKGALFTYKDYPFILHLGYNDTTVDSSTNQTDTVTYRANAALRGDIMNQSASYAHSDTTTALMSRITGEDYGYVNTIAYSDLQLYSRISDRTTDQTALPDRGYHTDTFMWSEQLMSPLPWNFSTELSYLYIDENDRSTTAGLSVDQYNRSTNSSVRLTHSLYDSLVSNFIISRTDISSTLGEITTDSWSVLEDYRKQIPTGRLLLNAQYGQTHYDQSGKVTILNEPHTAQLLGSFTLNSQNIAQSTISLKVKDPPTGFWLDLPPANYLVTPLGRTFQITILSVAPATPQANPAFLYEFRASYSLLNDSTIDMTNWGYGTDVDLVKNLLSGYFQYNRTEQTVVSGFFLGGNDVMVSETLGLRAARGSVSGLVERQVVRSRWTPFDAWRAKGNYRSAIAEEANFSLQLSGERYDYHATPTSIAYTNKIEAIDLGLDYRFPSINLSMFVISSYVSSQSLVDSDTLSLNSYATWQKGLLTITGGVQITATDTTYAGTRTSIYGDYVYLNLTRKLF